LGVPSTKIVPEAHAERQYPRHIVKYLCASLSFDILGIMIAIGMFPLHLSLSVFFLFSSIPSFSFTVLSYLALSAY
jgi:hypothetical protein